MREARVEDRHTGWPSTAELRRARPEEADALSALAVRSKAHWGYDTKFLDACRDELTLTPEFLPEEEVYVLSAAGALVGFYTLARWNADIELCHLFVEASAIGKGAGRLLWEDAVRRAEGMGYERLLIQSDPFAEGFYLRLGADRIGEVPSQALPGRVLPLLVYPLREP
jgi:GNAT superfamily N-acetyltransferase